ncbi:MAG: hypothetical protein ACI865_000934 [Flavobacteriaceae bacterium]
MATEPVRAPKGKVIAIDTPKDLFEEAKKSFETDYLEKFQTRQADLAHWNDTITNFTMNHFIERTIEVPVRYPGIKLTFDDPENEVVGNTLIYTIPVLDTLDLNAFKTRTMMGNFDVFQQLEFHRAIK